MAVAILLIVLVAGTVIFHFASPWWFTEIASNWGFLDTTVNITFWVTGIVYILLNGFLIWVVIKYRHKEGQRAHYEPESHRLEWWLTAITSVGVIAMLAPGLWVWGDIVTVPEDAAEVEVLGRQWNWSYRFPGEDGTLGRTDVRYMNAENPFGMDPNDPAGQDDVLAADAILHLPKDQPVKMLLRSTDVLHNFTVPQFRVKMDLVPGMVTYQWLTPIRTGTFDILCEELCGIAHYTMRGKVTVDEPADFEAWLDSQPTFAETEARPDGDPIAGQANYAICSACHGANGEGNRAMNAPKLAGQPGWYLEKQLLNYKSGLRGAHENDVYGQQMAPMAATLVDQASMDNVIAYIGTFPDKPAAQTITGNARNGAKIYANCKVCHGETGKGIWSLKAPRLAGTSDWYMATQLSHYQSGIRGAHPDDLYGKQMSFMAKIMKDEQAVNDVLAYINTLE